MTTSETPARAPYGTKITILVAFVVLSALAVAVVRHVGVPAHGPRPHVGAPVYEPVQNGAPGRPAIYLPARRAKRLVGVERQASLSANSSVLRFGAEGTGQVRFSWTLDEKPGGGRETPTGGSYRVWARLRSLVEGGEVRVSLTHANGKAHTAHLPAGAPGEWQWLDLGEFPADGQGKERVQLVGLGDAAWQLMGLGVVPDGAPVAAPAPPLSLAKERVFRTFGDRFDRSPGHGLGTWQERSGSWKFEFSLDPNRVPMQYSLHARLAAGGKEGLVVVDGPEWLGSRTSVSAFPEPGARCGIALETADGVERFVVQAGNSGADVPRVAPHQWCRLTVESWGWTRRFLVDGREVAVRHDVSPAIHRPGLVLAAGEARFDDVRVREVAWCAEDAAIYRMPWQLAADADWQLRANGKGPALQGVRGEMLPAEGMAAAREVVVWHDGRDTAKLAAGGAGATSFAQGTAYWFASGNTNWRLLAPGSINRLAVCSFETTQDTFRIGPYRFDAQTIPDPSDYLDFTPEEWEAIRLSPDADKLARRAKETRVVGRSNQYAIWGMESGYWRVLGGVLQARYRGRVRFWQELEGVYTLRFRVRLGAERSLARVVLGELDGKGIPVAFHTTGARLRDNDLAMPVTTDRWTECLVTLGTDTVTAQTRASLVNQAAAMVPSWSAPKSQRIARGIGGGLLLEANGRDISFDDVEVTVPRREDGQRFHAFDRRETDWLRDGTGWIDHGGVSCALASNWVSLVTPAERGMLWHKARISGDVLLATNIEENSEWLGWEQDPSHIHYPADNVVLCLGKGQDLGSGYRLEVNSRERTMTVLYRAGKEVASARQDYRFPIQYGGGHAPYRPRRNRISLVRQGKRVRGLVNGVEVLSYTDEKPLTTDTVGIGGYRTRINFSRIMVRELGAEQ